MRDALLSWGGKALAPAGPTSGFVPRAAGIAAALLLALVGLTALPGTAAGAAVVTRWSATLTVKQLETGARGCSNAVGGANCSTSSVLSDDAFTFASNTLVVRKLLVYTSGASAGRLELEFVHDLPSTAGLLFLSVDNTAFPFKDFAFKYADSKTPTGRGWNNSGLSWAVGDSVSLRIDEVSNSPPIGVPTIAGTARVGETLTASTSDIVDTDGLRNVVWRYQWMRVDADGTSNATDIGTDSSTYTLTSADQGKKVKVTVSFQDDAGFAGERTSDAYPSTGTVTATTNAAAIGKPTISGTPQVSQTLTTSTSDIADTNGLTGVSWRYQWIRIAGTTETAITGATSSMYTLASADQGKKVKVRVSFQDDAGFAEARTSVAFPSSGTIQASLPPPPPENTGGGSGGGGGGSSGGSSRDDHGNSAGRATVVRLASYAPWASSTPGQLNSPSDVDYFTLDVPQAGILVVETSGTTDTVGTVWQHGEELGMAGSGGERQNFHLSVPVEAGEVALAVAGNGRTGAYRLETYLVVGHLENPGPDSFQSGLGVVSGWVCAANTVEIELNGETHPAAYGTERADTHGACGDTDSGFGLLFNWNLLGDGEHEVVVLVDGVEFARTTVTATTLGAEFVRNVEGACVVADFPSVGESVRLVWQETQQNFVLAEGRAPTGASRSGIAGVGFLENPSANSFQSGIGVLSGWVCEAEEVVITIGDLAPQVAGYGTERLDTLDVCGDTDNGFGLLFNWNLLGDGEHVVIATVDGTELARTTVRVTTLGEEFVRGATGECVVADFPHPGETVTLTWQETSQNFVITDVE